MSNTVDAERVAGRLSAAFSTVGAVLVEAGLVEEGASVDDVVAATHGWVGERERLLKERKEAEWLIGSLNETVEGLEQQSAGWEELAERLEAENTRLVIDFEDERKTLITLVALADEYKHAVDHVATCGGTCQDCRSLAQAALEHQNLDTFLAENVVARLDGERQRFEHDNIMLRGDVSLLREQAERDNERIAKLQHQLWRNRRAARQFVQMTLQRFARAAGVSVLWEREDDGVPGMPKPVRRLACEVEQAIQEMW